jgi:hypothetical protein
MINMVSVLIFEHDYLNLGLIEIEGDIFPPSWIFDNTQISIAYER